MSPITLKYQANTGFTLLEVMVAVAITAVIGVGAVQLLSSISEASRSTEIKSRELANLQRFNQIVSRDIEQLVHRDIRDEFGDNSPALSLNSGDYPIEFTRTGWRNSPITENPRSTLQRVAYRTELMDSDYCENARLNLIEQGRDEETWSEDCLVRFYWPVLDRAPDTEALYQVVMNEILDLNIELYGREGNIDSLQTSELITINDWPPFDESNTPLPTAIRWTFTLPNMGEITRIWLISGISPT